MSLIRWRLGEPYSWAQVIAELGDTLKHLGEAEPPASTQDEGPALSESKGLP